MSLLAESHLTCHTFPEHGTVCLNLFCCRPRPAWDFEWGFVLAGRDTYDPTVVELPEGLRFLAPRIVPQLFDFPLDLQPVAVEANRLGH